MIRALRLTDLVSAAMFLRQAGQAELTSHTWPKVQPESGHLPVGTAFWQSLGMGGGESAWMSSPSGRDINGLAVARPRYGGLIWDVQHLLVAGGEAVIGAELLDAVCNHAASQGGRRVFLELPVDDRSAGLARRAGFERYTSMTLYQLRARFKLPTLEPLEGRPRLRVDEQPLFSLYGAGVPQLVRSAEAMTYDEWSALHRGRKKWSPTLIGDRHQFVWELGEGLAGWMEIVYGQKSQYLEFLTDPKYDSMSDRFVAFGMKQVSEKAAVYSTVRPYQAGLGPALERLGFGVAGRFDVYVRQLSIRVPERQLVPANIIGG
jgi:hypothetical protein